MNKLIHVLGVVVFGGALFFELCVLSVPEHLKSQPGLVKVTKWPGRWKYLTVWNVVLQLLFNIYSLVNDISGSNSVDVKKQTKLQRYRDVVFAGLIFPVGIFVSLSFWGLYAVDRELVYPKFMDEFKPSWDNHAVHTGPITFLALELLLVPKIFPKRSQSILLVSVFVSIYLAWIIWIGQVTGVWAYPILEILTGLARIAFIAGSVCFFIVLYLVGEKLHTRIWGKKAFGGSVEAGGKSKSGKSK